MLDIPKDLKDILQKLIQKGAIPILVGGLVRDFFLKIDSKDIDIEIYGLKTLEELALYLQDFGSVSFVGKSFGVLKLKIQNDNYDFSFPRTENKVGIGHTGFDVKTDGAMSYKDGARRRDFTINSIGYDYKNKTFIDPFLGIKDLENRVLKHIDEKTFIEDPLRVYRGVQFCARFGLKLEKSTKELFKMMIQKEEFKTLPSERIFEEYKKLLLKSNKPSLGLKLLNQLKIENISNEVFKYIDNIVKIKTQDEKIDTVLFFYYLEDILKKLSNDNKLLKDIENLKKFKVPKIFENQIESFDSDEVILRKKYFMMKNMPEPLIMGKDLIALGMKPNKKFKIILDKIYEEQLKGKINSKVDGEKLLKNLFL